MPEILPALETFGLSKRYGRSRRYALRDLDLTVEAGEVYGFLGPNGAGKSTTIRLLMNFIQPTHGNALILGKDMVKKAVSIKAQVGYLPGEVTLYNKLTGRQFLTFMSGLQPLQRQTYVENLAKLFQAELNKPIGDLSRGNKQKLALIQAFMHQPDLLILDEPTNSLDPLMQEAFYELVRRTKEQGSTFFISSHNLTEVQKICDKVGFIRKGRLVAEESISNLNRRAVQTYDIAFSQPAPLAELKNLSKLKVKANTRHHVTVTVRGELKPLFQILARYNVVSLERREINLEDEFLKYYKS